MRHCNNIILLQILAIIPRFLGNTDSAFSRYFDGAIKFAEFSEKYSDWPGNIDREGMSGIIDYYGRVKAWYQSNSK